MNVCLKFMNPLQHANLMQCIYCLKKGCILQQKKKKLEHFSMLWYNLKLRSFFKMKHKIW